MTIMNIQQTVINSEINAILTSGVKPVFFSWDITIHANGNDIKPLVINNVENERDYLNRLTDKITVEVLILQGVLDYDIVPYKSSLEITIRKLPLKETLVAQEDEYRDIAAFRYKATLYDASSNVVQGNLPTVTNKSTADRTGLVSVQFQLLHPVFELLRTQTYGGILRDMSSSDALVYIMSLPFNLTGGLTDKSRTIKGVTLAANSNTAVRDHVIIPPLTPLLKVPSYIHEHQGGIFSTGLGFYLQNNYWYVFSPFDLKAYSRSRKSLTIITVPANRLISPERSYRETPTQVFVLATGESKHIEYSESNQLNQGNGVVFMDATNAFEQWGKVEDNKLIIDRSNNVTECVIEQRENGLNFLRESPRRFTANPLFELSKLAPRYGDIIQHTWENANPDLLYPGMPIRNYYLSNNEAKELYGVLLGVHVFSISDTKGMVNKRFSSKCVLTMFIERKLEGG